MKNAFAVFHLARAALMVPGPCDPNLIRAQVPIESRNITDFFHSLGVLACLGREKRYRRQILLQ
jgi:hypothetical protein